MSLTLAMLHQSFNSSTWNPVFIDGFCHRHWEKLPCATHMDAALQGHYLLYLHHPTIRWSSQLYKNLPDISIKANAASLVFLTDCTLVIQSLQSPHPTPWDTQQILSTPSQYMTVVIQWIPAHYSM